MKKSNKILVGLFLVAVIGIVVTGCKKFLDRKPLSPTLNDYGSQLDGQAIGMYSIFNSYAGFNTLPWLDFNSIRDDDAQKGSSTTDGAEINTDCVRPRSSDRRRLSCCWVRVAIPRYARVGSPPVQGADNSHEIVG